MINIKSQKGITMVSLVIAIVILLILSGTAIYNLNLSNGTGRYNNMVADIELLEDKVLIYFNRYGTIPVLKQDNNNFINYTFSKLEFDKNANDNENYYILDLEAMENITLYYGEKGYKNPNKSDDVYIINEKTHTIYYVKGIKNTDGKVYHSIKVSNSENEDTIPPTKPQINIVSGDGIYNVDDINYKTNVTLEFVSGKDNGSGISKTTYSINDGEEKDISELKNSQYMINSNGRYNISVKTYSNKGIYSEETKEVTVGLIKEVDYLESSGTQYLDMGIPYKPGMGFYIKAKQTTVLEGHYYYPFGVYDYTRGNNYSSTGTMIGTRVTGFGTYEGYGVVDYGKRIGLFKDGSTSDTQSNYNISDNLYEGYCNYLNDSKVSIIINGVETIFNIDLSTRTDNAETSVNMTMFGVHLLKADGTDVPNQYTNNCIAQIYEVIITMNNQNYAHYKACYDTEKGDGYMFDIINKRYCYNKGTGTFKTNLDEL